MDNQVCSLLANNGKNVPLKNVSVNSSINHFVANVEVLFSFVNSFADPIETVYVLNKFKYKLILM